MRDINKSIEYLCELGGDSDELVTISLPKHLRDRLNAESELKGLSLSEEIYLRLCESFANPSSEDLKLRNNNSISIETPDWVEFIFNKKLAVNEKKRANLH